MSTPRALPLGLSLALLAFVAFAACSSPPLVGSTERPVAVAPQPVQPEPEPVPSGPSSVVQGQIQRGAQVYAQLCTRCHGGAGEGSRFGPAVIGPTALPTNPRPNARTRRSQFRTAMDIGMFIKGNMPPGGPQPPMSDIAATLAWLLQSNGITPTMPISPSTAGAITWSR